MSAAIPAITLVICAVITIEHIRWSIHERRRLYG